MVYDLPRFRPMGDRSLLVELGDTISPDVNRRVQRLMLQLQQAPPPGVREIAPGYRSLLVVYDPLSIACAELKGRIAEAAARQGLAGLPQAKLLTVPVFYGGGYGPDLEEVAGRLGIPTDEVIRLHTETIYRVYMIGFTPGYPYLGELPAALAVPRRSTPRTRVPKVRWALPSARRASTRWRAPAAGRSSDGRPSSCSTPRASCRRFWRWATGSNSKPCGKWRSEKWRA